MNAVAVENISVGYRSSWLGKMTPVLNSVSFEIKEGEAIGYIGQNGAGKTSTIKCLLNLVRAQRGTISLFGRSSLDPGARAEVGYLPEHPYWYENLTVLETIEFYGGLFGLSKKEAFQRANFLLEHFGLTSKLHQKMKSLSKGLMQRVGLIQALINQPKLLILDEPFSGLDPIGRKEFREIFLQEKQRGTTLFMSSHILSDVERLCDRALIIHKRTLARDVVIKDLRSSLTEKFEVLLPYSESFLAGDWAEGFRSAITHRDQEQIHLVFGTYGEAEHCAHMCIHQRVPLISLRPNPISLEDIFNEVVRR